MVIEMNVKPLIKSFSHYKDFEFYPHQEQAIEWFLKNEFPNGILTAPTGSGKSLIGMSIAVSELETEKHEDDEQDSETQNSVLYLCSSKPLQVQLEKDFPEARIMWGRSNFRCQRNKMFDCSVCKVSIKNKLIKDVGLRSPKCSDCPYEINKRAVLNSRIQILNYAYFLTEANFVGMFSNYPLAIADEADTLEKHLRNMISIDIKKTMAKRYDIDLPKRKTAQAKNAIEIWKDWGEGVSSKLSRKADDLLAELERSSDDQHTVKLNREIENLKRLVSKVDFFHSNVDETWVYQSYDGGHSFTPTWLPQTMTTNLFFRHSRRFLFMSATFPPIQVYSKLLGFDTESADKLELPSTFPVQNRQVVLKNTGDMSWKTKNEALPLILGAIKEILSRHKNEKGIIHTVSYDLTNSVMSIGDKRLVTHSYNDKIEKLRDFLGSTHPLVWVSPSSTRGIDLNDEKARFNIICKMPFQSMADKLVSTRLYGSDLGKLWYVSDAAQELVQACGRTNRHKDDYSVIYILDVAACNKICMNKDLWPEYFLEAVDIEF